MDWLTVLMVIFFTGCLFMFFGLIGLLVQVWTHLSEIEDEPPMNIGAVQEHELFNQNNL